MNFVRLSELVLSCAGKQVIFDPDEGKTLLEKFKISFTDILELKELGLINAQPNLAVTYQPSEQNASTAISYQNLVIMIERKGGAGKLNFKCLILTKTGEQLLKLLSSTPNMAYLKIIRDNLESDSVSIRYGDFAGNVGTQISVNNIRDIPR